jgi:HEAT repeat protein
LSRSGIPTSTPILEDVALSDRAPAVRKEALTLLADRRPERARQLLPRVLLDRAARVRELARFFVRDLGAPLVPRNVYIEGLATGSTSLLTAAIAGLGETGTSADVDLLAGSLGAPQSRVRHAALVASARLDAERGVPLALAGLADGAPSVRAAAVHILRVHARRVDFGIIISRLHDIAEAGTRKKLLLLAKDASKWDAAVLLLEALGDSDDDVRRRATELLDGWVAAFNRSHAQLSPAHAARIRALLEAHGSAIRGETAALLGFSLKTAAE